MSLLESAVSLAVWEAGRWFATGEVGRPLGSAHQSQAPYQAVRTADGWVTLGAITPKTWTALCDGARPRASCATTRGSPTRSARHAQRDELIPLIEERTAELRDRRRGRSGWSGAGVPCAPIADYGEVFTDEHLAARDFFWDAPHPVAGAGAPGWLADAVVAHPGAPRRGRAGARRHTRARRLREAGYTDDEIDALVGRRSRGGGGRERRSRVEARRLVLTVTFDRPRQHNAMTFDMYDGLHAACETRRRRRRRSG